MQTRLSVFCDRIIEAGWLAALVVVPLFFNVYSSRVFEPDKLTLLRSLVLLMALAWVIKTLEGFSTEKGFATTVRRFLTATPLHLPVLIFAGLYILTTITSVTPQISFWGSYQRLQGTLTNLSYITLFLLVAHHLRTRAQLNRILSLILLTSLPISLYGIIQHLKLDPLPWGGDVTMRVTSTMGNAIFLAAYLIMVVPITLMALVRSSAPVLKAFPRLSLQGRPASRMALKDLLPPLAYLGLLTVQLLTILFTKSRGPWLGLVVGVAFFALLLLLRQRRLFALGGASSLVLVSGAFIVFLNLPHSPLAPVKNTSPYLERLGSMLETESGTGRVRTLIWFGDGVGKGALGLITADPLRSLIGYGPESMYVAYNPFYPPDLAHYEARNATPDRSHNDFLDFLVTMGLLGLLSYLAIVGVFFFVGLRLLWGRQTLNDQLLILSLLAAVSAHLVETFFGIAIAATRTYLWLFLGLMMAISTMPPEPTPHPAGEQAHRHNPGTASTLGKGRKQGAARGVPKARAAQRLILPWERPWFYPLLVYGLTTALGVPLILLSNVAQRIDNPPGLVLGGFSWLLLGLLLTALWVERPASPRIPWRSERGWLYLPLLAVILFFLVYYLLGAVIADIYFKKGQAYENAQRFDVSAPTYLKALRWARDQDFYFLFLGRAFLELAKRTPEQDSKRSIQTVEDLFSLDVGKPQPLSREDLFQTSLVALREAKRLNPLNTDNSANLGRLYRLWAEVTNAPDLKKERFEEAANYYQQATQLSPNAAHLYDEWGLVYYLQGKQAEALEKYQRSLELDDRYPVTYLYLGDAYLSQEKLAEAEDMYKRALQVDPSLINARSALGFIYHRQGKTQESLQENLKVVEQAPKDFPSHRNLAILYQELGRMDKALEEAKIALELAPPDQKPPLQAFIDQVQGIRP